MEQKLKEFIKACDKTEDFMQKLKNEEIKLREDAKK